MWYTLYGVLVLILWTSGVSGLECFLCNVTNITDCTTTTTCSQKCSTRQHGIGASLTFELGCASDSECFQGESAGLVGRAIKRQSSCFQCCHTDRCNMNICAAGIHVISEVGQCADDPLFDCHRMSLSFNICGDIHHAKVTCRKFCGLCDLVDGNWSIWSSWSNCDITCGSGHMTRTRTCTDPAPAHGGLNCVGISTEIRTCNKSLCPVNGQWADWESWTGCSKTCGLGSQNRQRTCSNPKPSIGGECCQGTPADFTLCLLKGCQDGQWSKWSMWGNCTGSGLKSRSRECNNTAASTYGSTCTGSNIDYAQCPRPIVAFSVTRANKSLVNGHPIFRTIITNIGGGYDENTGQFTCQIPGLYYFTVTLFVYQTPAHVNCYICRNSIWLLWVEGDVKDTNDSGTVQTYLLLQTGDTVDICNCSNWEFINNGITTSFHGALITAL